MQSQQLQFMWLSEADTDAFATKLAHCDALRDAIIALQGDLGAGKTTFARLLLRSLGVTGRIKSPTYAVVESYQAPKLAIWHFDFYRFQDPREWEDAGFRELFASPGLKLVEWLERVAAMVPPADLQLQIQVDGDGMRQVTAQAQTEVGRTLLACLR